MVYRLIQAGGSKRIENRRQEVKGVSKNLRKMLTSYMNVPDTI